jgi:hypothetical protein
LAALQDLSRPLGLSFLVLRCFLNGQSEINETRRKQVTISLRPLRDPPGISAHSGFSAGRHT